MKWAVIGLIVGLAVGTTISAFAQRKYYQYDDDFQTISPGPHLATDAMKAYIKLGYVEGVADSMNSLATLIESHRVYALDEFVVLRAGCLGRFGVGDALLDAVREHAKQRPAFVLAPAAESIIVDACALRAP